MLLEQLKNVLPEDVCVFVIDNTFKTAEEGSVFADEYVITHKSEVRWNCWQHTVSSSEKVETCFYPTGDRFERKVKPPGENSDQCAYCFKRGHWKKDCPILRQNSIVVDLTKNQLC